MSLCELRFRTQEELSQSLLSAGFSVGIQPRHAAVWTRVAANALDLIIFGVPILLLSNVVLGPELIGDEGISAHMESLLQAVFLTLITILLWVKWDGRTPGKKVLRLRIVTYPEYSPVVLRYSGCARVAHHHRLVDDRHWLSINGADDWH